jgi:hypothetical protein
MKEILVKFLIVLVILLGFNGFFFFLGGTEHSNTVWICYGFIHVAFLCLLITPLLCRAKNGEVVLSASLSLRALFYFFTELIIGIGFLWYNPESYFWPVLVQGILLIIFLVLQLMSVLANDATRSSMEKQRQGHIFIQSLASDMKTALSQVSDPSLRKQMSLCYEALSCSSVESCPEAAGPEIELENAVNDLCSFVNQGDKKMLEQQIKQVELAMKKRNQAIRMARLSK